MNYHIALSRSFDLSAIAQEARVGKRPRHTMWTLSQALSAEVYEPQVSEITRQDRLCAKLIGAPEHWATARKLSKQLHSEDVVFCAGEDIGFPLAILCHNKPHPPKLGVAIMAPKRLRVRMVMRLFGLDRHIHLFLVSSKAEAFCLLKNFQLLDHQVFPLIEQTDEQFFKPAPRAATKTRPLIFSAGLEQRDYQTLADATQDLAVDVKVCAVSPNASAQTRVVFPNPTPDNMSIYPSDWVDFLHLYQQSDVVVVSLLDHNYSAGITVLMEAMACRRPVIFTRTPGFAEGLIDEDYVVGVKPGDAAELQRAILHLLKNPLEAEARAQRAYELFLRCYTSEQYVKDLVTQLRALSPENFQHTLDFCRQY